jgi:DNA-binding response OmpR family regulator
MDSKTKVLLAEDDNSLGFVMKDNLEENGYDVKWCKDGKEALDAFVKGMFDICLLDVMMPKKDGFALATDIRKKNPVIPILFLTARSMPEDKIMGFKTGADDYITKPFHMEELLLRMEVFLKRSRGSQVQATKFSIGQLDFDYNNLSLTGTDTNITLTQKEADLLKFICEHRNEVLKREDILLHVWGKDDYFLGRSMDVFITKLRKYIKEESRAEIQTVHGIGFKFVTP